MAGQPLLIVSNRGPCRFSRGPDGQIEAVRGGGGLVTALSGLAAVRPVTWIASALSDVDAEVAEEGPYRDGDLTVRLVVHDREEYDRYYNVFANPVLWFIHHYLWGLATEPSVDRNVRLAWDAGYVPVNQRFADAVVAARLDRKLQLGAHPVIGGHQQRIGIAGALQIEEAAEPAELRVGARPRGRAGERADRLHQRVSGLDRDAGVFVRQSHSSPASIRAIDRLSPYSA